MRACLTLAAAMSLAACSEQSPAPGASETQATQALTEAPAAAHAPGAPKEGQAAPVEVSVPQLAYAYTLGFVLPADKLAAAQDGHRAQCEALGPTRCQLLALERGGGADQTGQASLKLRVASNDARSFSDRLTKSVAQAGGRATDTKVAAEDVSKAITDTQARIRQRELLVSRLTAILRTRDGKVADLVEAERSVAQAQEELDQAKAWLVELRGRVAMSTFDINYTAAAPSADAGNVGSQLGDATQGSLATFLIGLRTLLTLAIYLLPWVLLAVPLVLGIRWLRRRYPKAPRPQP